MVTIMKTWSTVIHNLKVKLAAKGAPLTIPRGTHAGWHIEAKEPDPAGYVG